MLAVAACLCLFFLGWGLLHDAGEETPWVTAGIGASLILGGAVLMREAVLKRSPRVLPASAYPHNFGGEPFKTAANARNADKLTIERNAAILQEITRKSDAAEVLGGFGPVHREIFDLCDAYLTKNDQELRHIGTGSPRLGPLRKGREKVARYHRYHLLKWAEIETGNMNRKAMEMPAPRDKIDAAQGALGVIEFALGFYPDDRSLIDSRTALSEILVSIEVTALAEDAEREVFQGNFREARRNYRDALFLLGRDNVHNESRDIAAGRIKAEIEKLDQAEDGDIINAATSQ